MGAGTARRVLLAVVMAFTVLATAPFDASARGRAKVVWTEIRVAGRADAGAREKFLRGVVERETRRANWGAPRDEPIEAELHVTELTAEVHGDLVRVTCAGVGKLRGGGSARSRFSMGTHVRQRAALEKQLLGMLGRGVVTRLAEMARARRRMSHARRSVERAPGACHFR